MFSVLGVEARLKVLLQNIDSDEESLENRVACILILMRTLSHEEVSIPQRATLLFSVLELCLKLHNTQERTLLFQVINQLKPAFKNQSQSVVVLQPLLCEMKDGTAGYLPFDTLYRLAGILSRNQVYIAVHREKYRPFTEDADYQALVMDVLSQSTGLLLSMFRGEEPPLLLRFLIETVAQNNSKKDSQTLLALEKLQQSSCAQSLAVQSLCARLFMKISAPEIINNHLKEVLLERMTAQNGAAVLKEVLDKLDRSYFELLSDENQKSLLTAMLDNADAFQSADLLNKWTDLQLSAQLVSFLLESLQTQLSAIKSPKQLRQMQFVADYLLVVAGGETLALEQASKIASGVVLTADNCPIVSMLLKVVLRILQQRIKYKQRRRPNLNLEHSEILMLQLFDAKAVAALQALARLAVPEVLASHHHMQIWKTVALIFVELAKINFRQYSEALFSQTKFLVRGLRQPRSGLEAEEQAEEEEEATEARQFKSVRIDQSLSLISFTIEHLLAAVPDARKKVVKFIVQYLQTFIELVSNSSPQEAKNVIAEKLQRILQVFRVENFYIIFIYVILRIDKKGATQNLRRKYQIVQDTLPAMILDQYFTPELVDTFIETLSFAKFQTKLLFRQKIDKAQKRKKYFNTLGNFLRLNDDARR